MKVGIIGLGVIGRAQVRMFAAHHLIRYDIASGEDYPGAELAGCDLAVICVPTPEGPGGHADVTAVWNAVTALPDGVPALIRSTIPPGTTAEIAAACPARHVAHCPEFLHERQGAAWRESTDVPFLIIGGDPAAREYMARRMSEVHPGRAWKCDAVVAELAKYAANVAWATRVTMVNELAAVAAAHGVDWERLREAWLLDPRVSPAYTRMEGFPPGYGGACWPKDLAALTASSAARGYQPRFLEAVAAANDRFTAPAVTWDVLIATIPHRHDKLTGLLAELERQGARVPGFGVRVFRDNMETAYGDKCQVLVDSSAAEYVSFFDDDDFPAPDFVARVMAALEAERPDYVGFAVEWTRDGHPQVPVEHSLRHAGWAAQPDMLTRDIVHFNPIRRELALLGRWEGGYAADGRWADQVRASGRVRTEAWLDGGPAYQYRNSTSAGFESLRAPWDDAGYEQAMPLPRGDWLTLVGAS